MKLSIINLLFIALCSFGVVAHADADTIKVNVDHLMPKMPYGGIHAWQTNANENRIAISQSDPSKVVTANFRGEAQSVYEYEGPALVETLNQTPRIEAKNKKEFKIPRVL